MGSPIRRLACALSVAIAGVLVLPSPASAQTNECPDGVVIGGVCERPSPSPSPTPTQTSSPRPTQTNTPRPTQSNTPRPTQSTTSRPRPTATTTPTLPPIQSPTASPSPPPPYQFPTDFPPQSEGQYPTEFGEQRPPFPTAPGLSAAPVSSGEQGQGLQIVSLLILAASIAFLLVRARVRRWMIGI